MYKSEGNDVVFVWTNQGGRRELYCTALNEWSAAFIALALNEYNERHSQGAAAE